MDISNIYRQFLALCKERDLRKNVMVRVVMAVVLLVLFTYLFPSSESIESSYHVGMVWTQKDVVAPFSFPILKDDRQYEREKNDATAAVPPVVERRPAIETAQLETLTIRLRSLKALSDAHKGWMKSRSGLDSLKYVNLSKMLAFNPGVSIDFLDRWLGKETGGGAFRKIDQALRTILPEIYRDGVLDSGMLKQTHKVIALRKGITEELVASDKFSSLSQAKAALELRLETYFGESDSLKLAMNIGVSILVPNMQFNARDTQRDILIARDNVPKTLGFVQEGERIIGKNERMTEEAKAKLDSFRHAKAEEGNAIDRTGQWIGIFFHVLLILGLYGTYLFLFRKRIFNDNSSLGLITSLFCLEGLFAYATRVADVSVPLQFLIFVPMASMLLAIIYDSRVAFYGTVIISLLVAGIRGNDYPIALASIIAGSLGAYTVRDISNRTQIFRSIGFIFLGYMLSILALGLERFEDFPTMGLEIALGFGNALISSILTYALLLFFERAFNITTDLRLVELADINQPLLQRLSEEAPGTFHHSLMLGNLAEAAADEIGANSILAKVGAYYHDIGKLIKPEYFVENQVGTPNRHSKLKPRMSAKLIISHVNEGMELARAYKIPEKVVDFIPQHHGTTRLSFFFDKALKQAATRKNNKEVVQDEDYRYPGPRPQTKETAIVMLADTIEAATRSVSDVTPQKLELTVDSMIKHRLMEGELDECNLTMTDLRKIKEAFLQILIGIHHHRIQYPEQETIEAPPADLVPPSAAPVETQSPLNAEAPPMMTETAEPAISLEQVSGEVKIEASDASGEGEVKSAAAEKSEEL